MYVRCFQTGGKLEMTFKECKEKNNDTDPNKWGRLDFITEEEYWKLRFENLGPYIHELPPQCSTCGNSCYDMLQINVSLAPNGKRYIVVNGACSFSFCSHDCAKEGMEKILLNYSNEYGHDVTLRLKPVVE